MKFNVNDPQFRICLGWIAFTIYFYDIEEKINILLDIKERYDSLVTRLTEGMEIKSPTIN